MTDELQAVRAFDRNIWCSDYGTLVGSISEIYKVTETLGATRFTLEYHPEVDKS